MPFDRKGLLTSLIFDVALPEITNAIRKHHQATGEFPTDAQVKAELEADADRIITTGEGYLAQHGAAPASGDPRGSIVTGSTGD